MPVIGHPPPVSTRSAVTQVSLQPRPCSWRRIDRSGGWSQRQEASAERYASWCWWCCDHHFLWPWLLNPLTGFCTDQKSVLWRCINDTETCSQHASCPKRGVDRLTEGHEEGCRGVPSPYNFFGIFRQKMQVLCIFIAKNYSWPETGVERLGGWRCITHGGWKFSGSSTPPTHPSTRALVVGADSSPESDRRRTPPTNSCWSPLCRK